MVFFLQMCKFFFFLQKWNPALFSVFWFFNFLYSRFKYYLETWFLVDVFRITEGSLSIRYHGMCISCSYNLHVLSWLHELMISFTLFVDGQGWFDSKHTFRMRLDAVPAHCSPQRPGSRMPPCPPSSPLSSSCPGCCRRPTLPTLPPTEPCGIRLILPLGLHCLHLLPPVSILSSLLQVLFPVTDNSWHSCSFRTTRSCPH